jgi:two-component system, NtrC family, response regulator HydG
MQPTRNRILCIDDDEDTCKMMEVLLGMWNYEVVVASTAAAALHQIQSQPYDLYLLDTCFPEISGLELCEQICGVHGHAPVVFISAAVYETDKQNGLQAGAVAYLTKPLDFDALEITLSRLMQGGWKTLES